MTARCSMFKYGSLGLSHMYSTASLLTTLLLSLLSHPPSVWLCHSQVQLQTWCRVMDIPVILAVWFDRYSQWTDTCAYQYNSRVNQLVVPVAVTLSYTCRSSYTNAFSSKVFFLFRQILLVFRSIYTHFPPQNNIKCSSEVHTGPPPRKCYALRLILTYLQVLSHSIVKFWREGGTLGGISQARSPLL